MYENAVACQDLLLICQIKLHQMFWLTDPKKRTKTKQHCFESRAGFLIGSAQGISGKEN